MKGENKCSFIDEWDLSAFLPERLKKENTEKILLILS
jgi:hypothetical protein